MTEPIRVDALASDDRLLDMLATRTYDGADPLGSMLLSFAHACDNPSPAVHTRSKRRSSGRVALSSFVTAALLVSGAGVAAAVTDHLPDGVAGWSAGINEWWGSLPGLSSDHAAPTVVNSDASSPRAGTKAAPAATAVPTSSAAVVSPPRGDGAISIVPPGLEPYAVGQGAPAVEPTGQPATDPSGVSTTPGTPATPATTAPGKSGSAPGRDGEPVDKAGTTPNAPSDPKPASGRNIPPAVFAVIDLAPPALG